MTNAKLLAINQELQVVAVAPGWPNMDINRLAGRFLGGHINRGRFISLSQPDREREASWKTKAAPLLDRAQRAGEIN